MVLSCISSDFEKQIVLRASRLICVRRLRLCRYIRWVYFLLTTWLVALVPYKPATLNLLNRASTRCRVEGISRAESVDQSTFVDTVISVERPAGIAFIPHVKSMFIGFTADNDFRFGGGILSNLFWRNYSRWRRTVLRLMPRTHAVSRPPEPFIAILTMALCVSGLASEQLKLSCKVFEQCLQM